MNLKYFEIARKIAQTLEKKTTTGVRNKYRVVAILIPRVGNEIYIGTNKMNEKHGGSPSPFKSIHAEFDVINKIGRGYKGRQKIKDADIYVYRETSYGQALARPCSDCFNMLQKFKVSNIFYSDINGFYSYTRGKLDGMA